MKSSVKETGPYSAICSQLEDETMRELAGTPRKRAEPLSDREFVAN
jgi:hypothetical protein